jgi:hypothetical protein
MSIKETVDYNDLDDTLTVKTSYDNTEVIESNKGQINAASEFGRYKAGNSQLVHVGRIHEGDIVRLKNLGYNLLSPDREEWRRALLYIQQNEPHLLTVPGKPFAKKKLIWQ